MSASLLALRTARSGALAAAESVACSARVTPAARLVRGLGLCGLVGGLVCLGVLPGGCRKQSAENLGVTETKAAAQPERVSREQLGRPEGLLRAVALPHTDVAARLGAHRIESTTRWSVTQLPAAGAPAVREVQPGYRPTEPVAPYEGGAAWEPAPASLEEQRLIEVDAAGRLHAQNQNDHGYGVEAIADQEFLYMRMRYAPYVRRRPEIDELARLRAAAYEPGAALLEAVAPFLKPGDPAETTFDGRPAWSVALGREGSPRARGEDARKDPAGAWRTATSVEALEGTAVFDRERGALLELKLDVRFVSPRGTGAPGSAARPAELASEQVRVEAHHQSRVTALGGAVGAILGPAEWIDPPARPRPMLDRQELLSGLGTPARGAQP